MVLTRVKIHEYLGMTIDFLDVGKVRITIYDYVDEMIAKLPTKMIDESLTSTFLLSVHFLCSNVRGK